MTLNDATLVWLGVTIAFGVVALAIGYLLGPGDGLREGIAIAHTQQSAERAAAIIAGLEDEP